MTPELIVMLTEHDRTVPNAAAVFESCADAGATWFGFKEEGLPESEMRALFARMRERGKKTALEVVAYTRQECLDGARLAVRCGCDLLMGTMYDDEIRDLCRDNGLKYFPFVGQIRERPSILEGSAAQMLRQAEQYAARGADGIDLLGYRYTGDADALIAGFVARCPLPVCVAGSIDSPVRLAHIRKTAPWGFTIGSAFFQNRFGPDFSTQIRRVLDAVGRENRN